MEEMHNIREKCDLSRENFCNLVLETADSYIKGDRWNDAIQLMNYTSAIQGPLSEPIISQLFKKISKEAASLENYKALKVLSEIKEAIEKNNHASITDKCSIYNTLSCTYRRIGNLNQSKKYIEKALALVFSPKIYEIDKICTFLNSSSVLAAMGNHVKASESAAKALEIGKCLDVQNTENKTVLGMAYFQYAVEKEALKILKEAMKYYKKAFAVLRDNSSMQSMAEESRKKYEALKNEANLKPKSRPISANVRSKIVYRISDREAPKKFQKKSKSPRSSFISTRNLIYPSYFTDERNSETQSLATNKKEIEGILNRPPIGPRKIRSSIKTKRNESKVREFRISSQCSIRILPSRPYSGASYQMTPQNMSIINFEVETQPGISLLSNESPFRKIAFSEKSYENLTFNENAQLTPTSTENVANFSDPKPNKNVSEEINHEIKIQNAASKIQAAFRGKIVRDKLMVKKKKKLLYRAGKKIGNIYFLVLVFGKNEKFFMKLLNLQDFSKVYKLEILPYQVNNIEKVLASIHFSSEGIPILNHNSVQSSFSHIKRKLKKIGDENYILDCFKNEEDHVLIKAKDVDTFKEYSLNINRQFSNNISQEIDEKVIPKLRIKGNNLVLSQSLDNTQKLIYKDQKNIQGEVFEIEIFSAFLIYIVNAVSKTSQKIFSLIIQKIKSEFDEGIDNVKGKEIMEKLDIINEKLMLLDKPTENNKIKTTGELLLEEKHIDKAENLGEKIRSNINTNGHVSSDQTCDKVLVHEGILHQETIDTQEEKEGLKKSLKAQNEAAIKLQKFYRRTNYKTKNFSEILTKKIYYNSTFQIVILRNSYFYDAIITNSDKPTKKIRCPISILNSNYCFSSSTDKSKAYYLINIIKFYDPVPSFINNPIPASHYFANIIKSIFYQNIAKLSKSRSKEQKIFDHLHTMQISGSIYNIKTSIYESYLHIQAYTHSENLNLCLKSQILKGYPQEFPLKQILKQHVYPRIYLKLNESRKILHGPKKFEISIPSSISNEKSINLNSLLNEIIIKQI